MQFLSRIVDEIAPLTPGLITAGIFVASLLVLRVLFRREQFARKLRLPAVLIWLYLLLAVVTLVGRQYWPNGWRLIHTVSLFVLGLAIVLAAAVSIFDIFLGRYRHVEAPKIVRDIAVVVIYIVVILAVLSGQGVNLSSILTTSAVVTAILGLALQDLLSNIVAGIALQIERPFTVSEWVKFGDQEGCVLEMNWRSTKIQTLHNDIVIIPNNVITKTSVINFTSPTTLHRRKIDVGLRYDDPPAKVKASLLRALRNVDGVCRDPEPYVLLRKYDDFSVAYRVHFFLDDFQRKDRIEDEVRSRMWYQMRRDGLSIPYPIRDVNLRQVSDESERERKVRAVGDVVVALDAVSFLEPLSEREREQLARGIRREHFTAGEIVIRQDDQGDCFYIIADGDVDVNVDGKTVAALGPADYFGEMSLMTGQARSATVVCKSDCVLYLVGKRAFKTVIESNSTLVEAISNKLDERRNALEQSRESVPAAAKSGGKPDVGGEGSLVVRIRRFFNLR